MRALLKTIRDLLGYLKENKKWWLIPAVVALFIFGFLIATAGTSPAPVFIYPVV